MRGADGKRASVGKYLGKRIRIRGVDRAGAAGKIQYEGSGRGRKVQGLRLIVEYAMVSIGA